MANARALDKRRKSIRNIRKITRTMELIATARFKKAMDRATAATAYTKRITQVVTDLANAGLEVTHPLLEQRAETNHSTLLVLTANRGLCGGYNGGVIRKAISQHEQLQEEVENNRLEVSGKRGIKFFGFQKRELAASYTHFEDKPTFDEVEVLAKRYADDYIAGKLDRLDVCYVEFESIAKQTPVVETLLPIESLSSDDDDAKQTSGIDYEFTPSAEEILEEIVPASFRARLFKCFLDAAVSEQIARMVAMKGATENADEMAGNLSQQYNRARQAQITSELAEIIGGAAALE